MTWSIKKFIILHYRSSSQSSRAGRFRNLVTFSKVSACFANISVWAHPPSGSTFVWLNIWKQANKHHLLFGDGIVLVEKNNIQWFRWDLKNWGAAPQHSSCRLLSNQRCSPGAYQRLCSAGTERNLLPPEIVGHRLISAIKGAVCFAEGLPYPGLCLWLDAHTRSLPYTGSCLWLDVHTGPHEVPLSISLACLDFLWNMSEWYFTPEQSK